MSKKCFFGCHMCSWFDSMVAQMVLKCWLYLFYCRFEKLTYLVSLLPTDQARSAGVYCHFRYRVNRQKCANFLEWLVTVGVLQTVFTILAKLEPKNCHH